MGYPKPTLIQTDHILGKYNYAKKINKYTEGLKKDSVEVLSRRPDRDFHSAV